jgi:MFS transporter, FSR family, fosmidomycin resistance protein
VGWFGLITFVPLYEVSRGNSEAYGNKLLSLMLLAGGVGTLVAGPLADRIGRRPVLVASLAAMGPLVLVYVRVGGALGAAALALVGVAVIGTFGVSMVMSQEYLPGNIGLASGLTIGLAIGLGGVAAVGLGALADTLTLGSALYVCAAAPVAGLLLAVWLPSSRARTPLAPEPVAP